MVQEIKAVYHVIVFEQIPSILFRSSPTPPKLAKRLNLTAIQLRRRFSGKSMFTSSRFLIAPTKIVPIRKLPSVG